MLLLLSMIKKCLINVYYGKLPQYFKLWALSASLNKKTDFLIFTDNNKIGIYCKNFNNIIVTFLPKQQFLEKCSKVFGFVPSLKKPYKLCDFKLAYGDIFKHEIRNYNFWGFFDFDTILGDIDSFLPNSIFLKYENISTYGHLSFLRNNNKMITLYKQKRQNTKICFPFIFKNSKIWILDEVIRRQLIHDKNITNFDIDNLFCDVNVFSHSFIDYKNAFITNGFLGYFKNGKLYAIYLNKENVNIKEFMYIHLQKRKMKNNVINVNNPFLIVPNYFINYFLPSKLNKQKFLDIGGGVKLHPFYFIKKTISDYKRRIKMKIYIMIHHIK